MYVESELDWRGRRITFSVARVLDQSDRVLLVDDWIETGSQATAIPAAVVKIGATTLVGTSVIVNQAPDSVRESLNVVSLLRYHELPQGG